MPNTQVLDGAMKYGSFVATISSVAYILNNFQVSRPTNHLVDIGVAGLPARSRTVQQQATFTCEAQIATGSTAYPEFGDTFTATIDANYGEETWVIHEVTPNISNDSGSLTTLSISGVKALTGTITAS